MRKEGETEIVVLKACPVADGGPSCCRNCGGGWPGTKATTEQLTRALNNGGIDPEKLGCGPLVKKAKDAIIKLNRIRG